MGKTEVDQRHFPKTLDFEHFLGKIFLKTFPKNVAPFFAVILVKKKIEIFFKIIQKKGIDGGWSGPFSNFSQFFPLFPLFSPFFGLPLNFRFLSAHFRSFFGHFGPFLVLFGPFLGHFWSFFGLFWSFLTHSKTLPKFLENSRNF